MTYYSEGHKTFKKRVPHYLEDLLEVVLEASSSSSILGLALEDLLTGEGWLFSFNSLNVYCLGSSILGISGEIERDLLLSFLGLFPPASKEGQVKTCATQLAMLLKGERSGEAMIFLAIFAPFQLYKIFLPVPATA